MFMPDDSLLVPRGMRQYVIDLAKAGGIPCEIQDDRKHYPLVEIDSSEIHYRPYQSEAVGKLIQIPEGILVAPAGSGKTVMGLSLIPLLGQPTLWLTHTGQLSIQAKERALKFLPSIGEIGIIGGSKWSKGDVLTIGMIQTLCRNTEKLIMMRDDFGLVILDEAQHCPSRTFLDVVSHLNPYFIYGLTATPYRRDRLENLMFQTLGMTKTIVPQKEVEKHGGIIIPKVRYRTLSSKRIDGNNIQTILKQHIIDNTKRNLIIVGDVLAEAVPGNFCIVISDRREHCEMLYELISAGWEKTGIATGQYSKAYVAEQVERFNRNEITVLVTTFALLGEGFDVPFLNRAFMAMPFRCEAKAEQLIGRIQRTYPGKGDAIVYDYVDDDIGVLKNQFTSKSKDCRYRTYVRLGVDVEPY
jgi:superfamily II DNA or RNA helicase